MSGDARSPWTERERDALSGALRDLDSRLRTTEVELAVMRTKVAFFGGLFGVLGAGVTEVIKLLLHHG